MTHPLLDLRKFTTEFPPKDQGDGPWRQIATHQVHLRASTRMTVVVEQAEELAYGLYRSEKLADAGIYANDVDSHAFAKQLYQSLEPELSIRNLEHIVQVFAEQLAVRAQERQENVNHPGLKAEACE